MSDLLEVGALSGLRLGLIAFTRHVAGLMLATSLLAAPAWAQAGDATTAPSSADTSLPPNQVEQLRAQLRALREQADAIEQRLDAASPSISAASAGAAAVAAASAHAAASTPVQAVKPAPTAVVRIEPPRSAPIGGVNVTPPEKSGAYRFGKGLPLATTDIFDVNLFVTTYVRYINQLGLNKNYTDSFGRVFSPLRQQNIELAKVQIGIKGWLFDPNFGYNLYVWTQNAVMGQGAYIVAAGHINYHFSDAFDLFAGVQSVPTTRSTNRTFPIWLRNDNRTIADEFFRGSYTMGFWAQGTIEPGLQYRAMIANNLSILGVTTSKLDAKINTYSGALWWMPTTHEFGPAQGFGDFENHDALATLFGVHYTYSRENAEAQPDVNAFENTQLHLSDGTLLFKPGAFNTDGQVKNATYQMADLNAGAKYKGWSLEAEYYMRWLSDFDTVGVIPVDHIFDQGFQLQASTMLLPKQLQLYFSGSKIFGQYGSPYDAAIGINWWPFKRREMRVNAQGLYVDRSPVGYNSYVTPVGATGFIYTTDFVIAL